MAAEWVVVQAPAAIDQQRRFPSAQIRSNMVLAGDRDKRRRVDLLGQRSGIEVGA